MIVLKCLLNLELGCAVTINTEVGSIGRHQYLYLAKLQSVGCISANNLISSMLLSGKALSTIKTRRTKRERLFSEKYLN